MVNFCHGAHTRDGGKMHYGVSQPTSQMRNYRVFDNDLQKVCANCSFQKSSLELKTGGKISLSLVHFENSFQIKRKKR